MPRPTLLFLLVSAAALLAGCGDVQGPDLAPPGSPSSGEPGEIAAAPPPPPPPPPPPGGEGSTVRPPAPSAAATGRLEEVLEEMIAVTERMADLLSGLSDEQSAQAAAPKHIPLSQRREELMREIAALRLQTGDEGRQVAQKYGGRAKAAAEKMAAQEARLLGNPQVMMMWANALQTAQKTSPPPPPPPETGQGGAGSAVQQHIALQEAMVDNFRQITDLLATVDDEASARAAAPKLREYTGELRRLGKSIKLSIVSLSRQDILRMSQELQGSIAENVALGERLDAQIVRVAAGPAGGVIGAEINELLDTMESVQRGKRQRLERDIDRARGAR